MTPSQKQFSANCGASQKQIPVSSKGPRAQQTWVYLIYGALIILSPVLVPLALLLLQGRILNFFDEVLHIHRGKKLGVNVINPMKTSSALFRYIVLGGGKAQVYLRADVSTEIWADIKIYPTRVWEALLGCSVIITGLIVFIAINKTLPHYVTIILMMFLILTDINLYLAANPSDPSSDKQEYRRYKLTGEMPKPVRVSDIETPMVFLLSGPILTNRAI